VVGVGGRALACFLVLGEVGAQGFAEAEAELLASRGDFVEVVGDFSFGVEVEAVGLGEGVLVLGGGGVEGVVVLVVELGHGC